MSRARSRGGPAEAQARVEELEAPEGDRVVPRR